MNKQDFDNKISAIRLQLIAPPALIDPNNLLAVREARTKANRLIALFAEGSAFITFLSTIKARLTDENLEQLLTLSEDALAFFPDATPYANTSHAFKLDFIAKKNAILDGKITFADIAAIDSHQHPLLDAEIRAGIIAGTETLKDVLSRALNRKASACIDLENFIKAAISQARSATRMNLTTNPYITQLENYLSSHENFDVESKYKAYLADLTLNGALALPLKQRVFALAAADVDALAANMTTFCKDDRKITLGETLIAQLTSVNPVVRQLGGQGLQEILHSLTDEHNRHFNALLERTFDVFAPPSKLELLTFLKDEEQQRDLASDAAEWRTLLRTFFQAHAKDYENFFDSPLPDVTIDYDAGEKNANKLNVTAAFTQHDENHSMANAFFKSVKSEGVNNPGEHGGFYIKCYQTHDRDGQAQIKTQTILFKQATDNSLPNDRENIAEFLCAYISAKLVGERIGTVMLATKPKGNKLEHTDYRLRTSTSAISSDTDFNLGLEKGVLKYQTKGVPIGEGSQTLTKKDYSDALGSSEGSKQYNAIISALKAFRPSAPANIEQSNNELHSHLKDHLKYLVKVVAAKGHAKHDDHVYVGAIFFDNGVDLNKSAHTTLGLPKPKRGKGEYGGQSINHPTLGNPRFQEGLLQCIKKEKILAGSLASGQTTAEWLGQYQYHTENTMVATMANLDRAFVVFDHGGAFRRPFPISGLMLPDPINIDELPDAEFSGDIAHFSGRGKKHGTCYLLAMPIKVLIDPAYIAEKRRIASTSAEDLASIVKEGISELLKFYSEESFLTHFANELRPAQAFTTVEDFTTFLLAKLESRRASIIKFAFELDLKRIEGLAPNHRAKELEALQKAYPDHYQTVLDIFASSGFQARGFEHSDYQHKDDTKVLKTLKLKASFIEEIKGEPSLAQTWQFIKDICKKYNHNRGILNSGYSVKPQKPPIINWLESESRTKTAELTTAEKTQIITMCIKYLQTQHEGISSDCCIDILKELYPPAVNSKDLVHDTLADDYFATGGLSAKTITDNIKAYLDDDAALATTIIRRNSSMTTVLNGGSPRGGSEPPSHSSSNKESTMGDHSPKHLSTEELDDEDLEEVRAFIAARKARKAPNPHDA